MKKAFLLLFFLNTIFSGNAQTNFSGYYSKYSEICPEMDSIIAQKIQWKKEEDDIAFPDKTFPPNQYSKIFNQADSIYSLIRRVFQNCNGFAPVWYRGIRGNSYLPDGPVPYSISTLFFEYYCSQTAKKVVRGDETGIGIDIHVNRLQWFMNFADSFDIKEDGVLKTIFQLPPVVGRWHGLPVYELKISRFFKSYSVIIGSKGRMPWRSLTQREYVTGLKGKFEKALKSSKPGSSSEADYRQKLLYISDFLSSANDEALGQAAIIHPKAGIWGFKGKFGDEATGGQRLVLSAMNKKYFDTSLPRFVPQLMQVYWSFENAGPVGKYVKEKFETDFPLQKLKSMIK